MDPKSDVQTEGGQVKRRACDECRSRKLACSKEPDGCARCKREGIRCHYSPQKPMGRPRKRRRAELLEEPATQKEQQAPPQQPELMQPALVVPEFDPTIGMDLDMSFLDMDPNSINFLDLLGPDFGQSLPDSAAQVQNEPVKMLKVGPPLPIDEVNSGALWAMGNHPNDIDFDPPPLAQPPPSQSQEISLEEVAQLMEFSSQSSEMDKVPSLSPQSTNSHSHSHSHSPSAHATTPPATVPTPPACGCLAALYLALDSLQNLPTDVAPAMKVARTAAKNAHDAILCPVCSKCPLDFAHRVSVAPFQTQMMLGALLPSLSNAYMRIVDMVDAEAKKADAERRKIVFTLEDYGGIWGMLLEADEECGATANIDGAVLEPTMWRLTVRALLKVDVYGINDKTRSDQFSPSFAPAPAEGAGGGGDFMCLSQPGLKDIITMLEERQRTRHQKLDEAVAAGLIQRPVIDYMPLSSGDRPTCMRIIDIAKRSMNDLIIP
ncbi:hypothetical protein QBC46DRAFT_66340 [Diplogelasinospora grovesii]|uniref:Zn(2)-C6 fungal-type domain-containing protein n=1 Tax=Diplogelasinospora grovesii TaxID=303347 RepID=A0AAN6NBH9_9PEZI|nr:hypothetical protein QBC46DRAFT_66340 [Diplogelasinospora grovesii]